MLDVLSAQSFTRQRHDDEVRRVGGHHVADALGTGQEHQVGADAVGGHACQGRCSGEGAAADDQQPAVLPLVSINRRNGEMHQVSRSYVPLSISWYPHVGHHDLPAASLVHASLDIVEGHRQVRAYGQ